MIPPRDSPPRDSPRDPPPEDAEDAEDLNKTIEGLSKIMNHFEKSRK